MPDQSISATIGTSSRPWHFHSSPGSENVFDIASPNNPSIKIKVSTGGVLKASIKHSALVIIDMQNYFLSEAIGRTRGSGHDACDQLVQHAIPAARKAGMQIIWLNWGLTDKDMETMPAAVTKAFGFYGTISARPDKKLVLDRHGEPRIGRNSAGLASPMGKVTIPGDDKGSSPQEIDGGKVLTRDSWNADLYPPLKALYEAGLQSSSGPADVWIHKNRMSGLWGSGSDLQKFLEAQGLTTLFFAGVNTDQCVGGTLTDAFSNGYDCVLLRDGCGTTSPKEAQQAWEFNCENTFGFLTSCRDLWDAAGCA